MGKDDNGFSGGSGGSVGTVDMRATGPWWARLLAYVGAPTFLLAFLLGAIPGLSSPLMDFDKQAKQLARHERTTWRLLQMTSLVCQGVWQGNPQQQSECRETMRAIITDDNRERRDEVP